jgi:hypothetical protein
MSNSDKHKHKTLSAKAEIIKKLDKGEKLINLAKKYVVGHTMIYDIRKNTRNFSPNFFSDPLFSVIRRYLDPISVGFARLYCTILSYRVFKMEPSNYVMMCVIA